MSAGMRRELSAAGRGPIRTERSASRTWSAFSSAVEYTATASIPSSCSARITRTAISPRLATRTRSNTARVYGPAMDVPEAQLEETEHGLVYKGDGWFVVNAEDVRWRESAGRGRGTNFGGDVLFDQIGIGI